MGHLLLLLVVALVAAALVFGVTVLIMGGDQGMEPAEPDGRAVPLPGARPLTESDLGNLRFDVAFRGYRMAQVDQALRRASYDVGYKDELISVLEAEVEALRDGRLEDADRLREARERAAGSAVEELTGEPVKEAVIELTPAEPRADLPPLPSPAPVQATPASAATDDEVARADALDDDADAQDADDHDHDRVESTK